VSEEGCCCRCRCCCLGHVSGWLGWLGPCIRGALSCSCDTALLRQQHTVFARMRPRCGVAHVVAPAPFPMPELPHPLSSRCCNTPACRCTVEPGPPAGGAGAAQPRDGRPAGLPVWCAADRP
jgi:hypothetical protein